MQNDTAASPCIISMVFTKLFLENTLAIWSYNYKAASELVLSKVAHCIPVLSLYYTGRCTACAMKHSGKNNKDVSLFLVTHLLGNHLFIWMNFYNLQKISGILLWLIGPSAHVVAHLKLSWLYRIFQSLQLRFLTFWRPFRIFAATQWAYNEYTLNK